MKTNTNETFSVSGLSAAPGAKTQGFMTVPGAGLSLPLTLINGSKPGKTVVVTGGIHGGEYPGIETAIRLAANLDPSEISGRLAIVHPANPRAFFAKLQYLGPDDGKNLNRMFPGKALGTVSERIAYAISTELFPIADFYMDLHGGDIHEALVPFVIYPSACDPEVSRVSAEAASRMGIPYVVGAASTNGTFGCAAQAGVPGFLAEIGQCGLWSEEEVASYLRGVSNVLAYLGVLPGPGLDLGPVTRLPGMVGAIAAQSGCWYPSVKPGDRVEKGQKLGEIRDFFARPLGEYFAPQDGTMLFVVTSLAINEGEPLAALG